MEQDAGGEEGKMKQEKKEGNKKENPREQKGREGGE